MELLFRLLKMFDRPISQFLDLSLFPSELMEMKGEAYVLGDSELPIVVDPYGMRLEAHPLKISSAKNKKLLRKSLITIKTGVEFLTVVVRNHDFGSVEMKHATAVLVIGLESLEGNIKDCKFKHSTLEKMRNVKLCITRSRRFKTWHKIDLALNLMRAELPKIQQSITNLMFEIHDLLVGTNIGKLNTENWSKIMKAKPDTI
jgi:hypothetical protein